MRPYKLFTLFLVLNITFQLISDATAGKIVSIFGYGVSVTVLYFPVVYIISDVVTEVYGYAMARRLLWYTVLASVIAGLCYQLAVLVPPASFFENGDAYEKVFGIVPRVLIGGWVAVFFGDIANNYVLAKLKIQFKGNLLWMRTISSTIVGQLINTLLFYVIALSGILPINILFESILVGWVIKTLVEVAMTPVTYLVINRIKAIEKEDFYDTETNFNPFKLS